MATIDLTGITNAPYVRRATSVATTWQEFSFPFWITKVSVIADSAVYIGFIGAETPADGGAVGSHYFPVGAGGAATVGAARLRRQPHHHRCGAGNVRVCGCAKWHR